MGWPTTWSASAMMPANNGVASLVPQTSYQPAGEPGKLWYVSTGLSHDALMEMSGTPRRPPTTEATPFWKVGLLKKIDLAPPLPVLASFQTGKGVVGRPWLSICTFRPPTAVPSGSPAAQDVTGWVYNKL